MEMWLILTAIAVSSLSGLPAALGPRHSVVGQRLATTLLAVGGALGLYGSGLAMMNPNPIAPQFVWALPLGRLSISVDALSAMFLAPVFVVPALGSIYGLAYWRQTDHPENGRKLSFFYGLLAGSMALVVIARDAVLFLIAWEIMAVSAFFLATTEDDNPAVRHAGWVYFIATHVGTLCLLALFALLRHATGSFDLEGFHSAEIQPAAANGIFLLALVGFGVKAGLAPFHVWLPGAHSNAPSHVSAVMSGVMLKMGIYGMVRTTSLLPTPPTWWGGLLLGLGAASGVFGIAFALAQRDLKRLLAYSSIENIGIIAMGLGLALLGRALSRPEWIVLGLGGALLHVWNHSLFKSLLFLNAGAIIHAVHTREVNRLGGLAKQAPMTAGLFLFGAVALCALPPLNGFVGEWLIYMGMFRTVEAGAGPSFPAASVGAPAMALIGALATACFVSLYGAVFLGEPRSPEADGAHDLGVCFTLPMMALATGCLFLGVIPQAAVPMLDQATRVWAGTASLSLPSLQAVAPLGWITVMALILTVSALAVFALVSRALAKREVGTASTWACGYALPTPRMQYTHSSSGDTLVSLFEWALWPKTAVNRVAGLFPRAASFERRIPDTVLDRLILPAFQFVERRLFGLRRLQQGRTEVYLFYILAIVLVLLAWGALGD